MPKYYEEGAVAATFAKLRAAYLPLGLVVQELPITYSSSPVKYVHDGVPYLLDCYHDIDGVAQSAAKFYILLERHHADIKRLYEAWQPLCPHELMVMSGGGLQLQAFFTAKNRYRGILYLSLIDDGRFAALEEALRHKGVPFKPYRADATPNPGPYTLVADEPWFSTLPDVPNIRMRSQVTHRYRD